jgi:peptidoglycan-associated lipoprotein
MKKINILHLILMVTLAAFLFAGCAKKPVPAAGVDETPVVTEIPSQEITGLEEQAVTETGVDETTLSSEAIIPAALNRVHFDFDQYTLTSQAREILANNAVYMEANPGIKVVIEGHCDNRGSDEYNLALGERRALAAKNYLVSLGVSPDRLSVISYGEEMPLDLGDNEEAWAKNRRADFKAVR